MPRCLPLGPPLVPPSALTPASLPLQIPSVLISRCFYVGFGTIKPRFLFLSVPDGSGPCSHFTLFLNWGRGEAVGVLPLDNSTSGETSSASQGASHSSCSDCGVEGPSESRMGVLHDLPPISLALPPS